MKKLSILCALLLSMALVLTGCDNGDAGAGNPVPGGVAETGVTQNETDAETSLAANTTLSSEQNTEELKWDKIPMIMVNNKLYYNTGKENTLDRRCGTLDGEITSTVDGSEIPTEDNQSNFGSGFGYQYGADDTIEVFMNEKWIIFEHRAGDGSQVRFGNKMVDADGLSEETLEWLEWYNRLPEEVQLKVNAVPADLLEESGILKTEDAAAEAN